MGQAVSAEDVKKEAVKFFTTTFGARFKEEWLRIRQDATNEHDNRGNEWHKISEWVVLSLSPETIQSSKYPTADQMTIFVPNKWGSTGSIHMSTNNWTTLNRDENMAAPTLKAMTKLLEEYFKPDASQSSPPPAVGAHAVLLRMCDLLEA